MQAELQQRIRRAAEILTNAKFPLFLSGAGISAESGIPTFRGSHDLPAVGSDAATGDGPLWTRFKPEELATPAAFLRDPALVWDWYNWRKKLISQKQPNAAHHATAELGRKLPNTLFVTQNVDGFHSLAGLPQILEMHGNIFRARCNACAKVQRMTDDVYPHTPCPACRSSKLRPDIVWFGETLPKEIMHEIHARLRVCDAIVVVGTSGSVYPAAGFAVEVRRHEGHVIEINVDDEHKPYANDVYLRGKAAELLPALVAEIRTE
jgi:NAD-dependent deacetylase